MENTGSIKRKVVAKDLQEERDKCNFDKKELQVLFHGGQEFLDVFNDFVGDIINNPHL
jgi:hypothetical protein